MPPPAEDLPSESALSVADVGPRLRIGEFETLDGRRALTDLVDAPNPGGPLKDDWRRTWSRVPSITAAGNGRYAAITGSEIAPPLQAVLVTDLAAAERRRLVSAMRGQGFLVGDSVAKLATEFLQRSDPNEFAERIRNFRAALVLIAFAGPQGVAATELAAQTVLHLYCAAAPLPRPVVALMGDEATTAGARRILDQAITVITLDPDAAQPDKLKTLHRQFASAYLAANAPLANRTLPPQLVGRPLIPITAALRRATWRLSHLMGLRLAVAHVEPRGITLALADRGSVRIANFGYFAGGHRGGHFGLQLPVEEVARWLPIGLPEADIRASLLERAGRPWGVPSRHRDRLVQEAAIVAGLARARAQLRLAEFECDLVVASGAMLGVDCAPLPAAACLLNGLLPVRFCQLAQDQASALPMLGCMDLLGEPVDPSDALAPLAVSIAPTGAARVNEPALHVAVQRNDGTSVEEVVPFGATLRVAALAGNPVRIGAMPAGGLDVGGGPGRAVGLSPVVDTGVGGLLVDARGRPPADGADAAERAQLVLAWLQGLSVYGPDSPAVFGAPE